MNWFKLAQGILVEVAPSLTQIPLAKGDNIPMGDRSDIEQMSRSALQSYFSRVDPNAGKFFAARYRCLVTDIDDREYQWLVIKVKFEPNYDKAGEAEKIAPDHPSYDYYQKHRNGLTGRTQYKTPKDAVTAIPHNPQYAYRGMAWEEWQFIRKNGFIQSKGHHNIGQEGYTLFGDNPLTAMAYAHGFAPMPYQVGFRRPGVVIAIDKTHLLTNKQDPENIPPSELGLKGKLPITEIKNAWMLVATKTDSQSFLDLRIPWVVDKTTQGGNYILDPSKASGGSGNLGVVVSYSIREML